MKLFSSVLLIVIFSANALHAADYDTYTASSNWGANSGTFGTGSWRTGGVTGNFFPDNTTHNAIINAGNTKSHDVSSGDLHTSGSVTVYGTLNLSASGGDRRMGNLVIKNGGVVTITTGTYTVTGTITIEAGGTLNVNGGTLITTQSSGNSLLVYGTVNLGAGRLERRAKMIIYQGGLIRLTAGSGYLAYSGTSANYSQIDGTFDGQTYLTNLNYSNYVLGEVNVTANTSTGRIRTQTAFVPSASHNISASNNFFGFNDSYGGTVEYYGSSAITLALNSRYYYYDFEVNNSGGVTLYSSCTSVSGNLYLRSGNLSLSSKQINIHGTIIYTGTNYINASGGTGRLHLQGKTTSVTSPCMNYFSSITTGLPAAGGTSISSQGLMVDIKNPVLRFSAAGGSNATLSELKVFRSDIVTLNDNVTIIDLLSVKVGVIKTGNYVLFLNNSGTAALEFQTTNYSSVSTVGWISGNLKRRCATGWSYDFPVGRTDVSVHTTDYIKYRHLNIELNSVNPSPCYITVNFNTVFNPGTCDGSLNVIENGISYIGLHPEGWWSVIPDAVTSVDYNINAYLHGFSSPLLIDNEFGLLKRQDASVLCSDWNTGGGVLNALNTPGRIHEFSGSLETGYAKRSNFSAFSQFAIGRTDDPIPLPVELLAFNVICQSDCQVLKWTTLSETENHGFYIERSVNGSQWETVGFVEGSGTSNQTQNYSFTDKNILNGNIYFRIRQTDFDGAFEYYGPVVASCDTEPVPGAVQVYPNPATSTVWIFSEESLPAIVEICHPDGRVIFSRGTEDLSIPVNLSIESLPHGLYYLRLLSTSGNQTVKLIKF